MWVSNPHSIAHAQCIAEQEWELAVSGGACCGGGGLQPGFLEARWLSFPPDDQLVGWQLVEDRLGVTGMPADNELFHLGCGTQPECLAEGVGAEAASAVDVTENGPRAALGGADHRFDTGANYVPVRGATDYLDG